MLLLLLVLHLPGPGFDLRALGVLGGHLERSLSAEKQPDLLPWVQLPALPLIGALGHVPLGLGCFMQNQNVSLNPQDFGEHHLGELLPALSWPQSTQNGGHSSSVLGL